MQVISLQGLVPERAEEIVTDVKKEEIVKPDKEPSYY